MKVNHIDACAAPKLRTASANAGSATVVTISPDPDNFWALDWISYSYATAPTNGRLTVTLGGVMVFDLDITAAGPGHINFEGPLYQEVHNQTVVVTLADGASVGKLNIRYR